MSPWLAPLLLLAAGAPAPAPVPAGYDDTPLLPGGEWRVHDGGRPRPGTIAPAPAGPSVPPPGDATVLLGRSAEGWRGAEGGAMPWKLTDGVLEVAPGSGDLVTRDAFGSGQLHVEWATPAEVKGASQGRGNSGVFLMGLYEVQVLDSFENPTYADGQAGAIYGQFPPLVNASRRPGEWQTYDIVFTAPVFVDGRLVSPAFVTVLHNGVLVQAHRALLGATIHREAPAYAPHAPRAPLRLQDHGNPVRFRNIWIRPLD